MPPCQPAKSHESVWANNNLLVSFYDMIDACANLLVDYTHILESIDITIHVGAEFQQRW